MKLSSSNVQKFLLDRFGLSTTNVTPINQGEWSQAFFYRVGKQNKVVRFSSQDEDFNRDQFASNFTSPSLPIPKIEKIGQAFNGYFAISSKVDGKMIDNLNPAEMQQVLPALLELLNSLRMVDTSKTIGYGSWNPDGNGTSQSWKKYLTDVAVDSPLSRINGWKAKLVSHPQAYKIFNQLYDMLLTLVPFCPEYRHLIHNDLLHYNLLIKNNQVVAVIDWGCALYGDFLYDFAMFTTWQFYYPSMKGIDFIKKAKPYFAKKGAALSNFDHRLKCYQYHLILSAMTYYAFKENHQDMEMVVSRIKQIIDLK